MSSPHWRQLLEARAATTAGQYNLSIAKLSDVPIPLPPIGEQRSILAVVEEGSRALERCVADTLAQQRRAEALHRALLQAAFTGRLVEQRREDHPADLLLKSIIEERQGRAAAAAEAKRTVRTTRGPRAPKPEETDR